jgi:hypothetical protein
MLWIEIYRIQGLHLSLPLRLALFRSIRPRKDVRMAWNLLTGDGENSILLGLQMAFCLIRKMTNNIMTK